MSRAWASVLAVLALVLSACAGPPRQPLARITGACPLLVSVETGFYLDNDLVPVEHNYGGINETVYACDYNRDNKPVVGMIVSEFPSRGQTATDLINSIVRRSRVETTPIAGVGDAAVFYEQKAGFAVFAAAKRSGPNIRVISFSALKPFASYRLAALGAIAMARL
jgi:hypothetical protein